MQHKVNKIGKAEIEQIAHSKGANNKDEINSSTTENGRKKFAIFHKSYNPANKIHDFRVDYAKKITTTDEEIKFIINDLNERMMPFHYSICNICGILSLHYGRFSPDGRGIKNNSDKDDDLVLGDITFWFPRIAEIASIEGISYKLYAKYLDDFYNLKNSKQTFSNIERSSKDA